MAQHKNTSIMKELEVFAESYDKDNIIENRATNIVSGVANLFDLIDETYTDERANDLKKRLLNSIKSGDNKKFLRGMQVVKEERHHSRNTKKG